MSDSDAEDITPPQPPQADDHDDTKHALFWDAMPEDAESHPDYIALKALEEETPPEERAENFKVGRDRLGAPRRPTAAAPRLLLLLATAATAPQLQTQGNNKLRIGLKSKNRLLLREAADFYTKGLGVQCGDARVNTALYNNRAHVNSLLGGLLVRTVDCCLVGWRVCRAPWCQQQLVCVRVHPQAPRVCFVGTLTCRQLAQRVD
jgi:hypothetical protein